MKTNYAAVFVSALAYWILGALWYGLLFNKPWMALEQMTAEKRKGHESGFALRHHICSEFADCVCFGADLHLAECEYGGAGSGVGNIFVDWICGAGDIHYLHVRDAADAVVCD